MTCRPSSDLEEKLVTTWSAGTGSVLNTWPLCGSMSVSWIADVTPKLASTDSLFQTLT